MLTPILLVLLDGLGDRPHPELGGLTTGEAAPTPNLDALVARSVCGMVWPLGPGRAPSSELAHWVYFTGSMEQFPGRAVLEALGHGVALAEEEVVAYACLREGIPADQGSVRLGARAGPDDEEEGRALLEAVQGWELDGLRLRLHPVAPGEAILRVKGEADPSVSDTDAFEEDLHPLLACRPLIEHPPAVHTARAVDAWTVRTRRSLRHHPLNRRRRAEGRPCLDVLTTKWWGRRRPVVRFQARTGLRGAVVSDRAYQGGLAEVLGLSWERPEPAPWGEGSLAVRLAAAGRLLEKGYDFVHCHDKAADEAGHRKDPQEKAGMIASLDRAVGLLDSLPGPVVVLTGDHATPARGRMLHSGDAVPLAIAAPGRPPDPVGHFGERYQVAGWLGHVLGRDVLPLALDAADRARFMGGRVGGAPLDAWGVPLRPEPLMLDE